jgi:hypothetical protein
MQLKNEKPENKYEELEFLWPHLLAAYIKGNAEKLNMKSKYPQAVFEEDCAKEKD